MQRLVQQGTPQGPAQRQSVQPAIFSTPGRSLLAALRRPPPSTSKALSKLTSSNPPVLVHCNTATSTSVFVNPRPSTNVSLHEHTMNSGLEEPSIGGNTPFTNDDNNPYSLHKHLSSDGCVVCVNLNAAYPPFGVILYGNNVIKTK